MTNHPSADLHYKAVFSGGQLTQLTFRKRSKFKPIVVILLITPLYRKLCNKARLIMYYSFLKDNNTIRLTYLFSHKNSSVLNLFRAISFLETEAKRLKVGHLETVVVNKKTMILLKRTKNWNKAGLKWGFWYRFVKSI